jgi:alpha-mannosidase
VATKSLATLTSQIDTGTGVPVVVFNTLGWQRSGVTEVSVHMPTSGAEGVTLLDEKNRVVPSQVLSTDAKTNTYQILFRLNEVPSLGYVVLHAVAGKRGSTTDLNSSGMTIENVAVRVTVDPQTGCIISLFDKKSNFETIAKAGCGNELQAFKDTPKDFDAWNVDPGTFDIAPTLLHNVDSVKLVEQGPLRSVIRVTRIWQSSKFVQDITLYTADEHVVVTNDIDWHEAHILLKASFPLAARSDKATYEIPYGTIERPTTRNNSFEKARFEFPRCAGPI